MSTDSFFPSTKVALIAGLARYVLMRSINGAAFWIGSEEFIGM
jgi:hypothetical protein